MMIQRKHFSFWLVLISGLITIFSSGCTQKNNVYNDRLRTYLQDNFKLSIDKTDKLLILNCQGCFACEQKAYSYVIKHKLFNSMNVIMSKTFYNKVALKDNSFNKKCFVDENDITERINLPFYGTTLIKIKDGVIEEVHQMTIQTLEKNELLAFFNH